MKTRYKHGGKNRKKKYGIGGAVMTLGKNLLQGKKFGSGALKGVLRAGITPGSGIGAGIGLAGAGLSKIGEKTGREGLQKLGKGIGKAGGLAGMFTGGGGGEGLQRLLQNYKGGGGGEGLMSLLQGLKGEQGMRVKKSYQGGGYVPQYNPYSNPQAQPPPQAFTPGPQLTKVEQAGMGGYDEAIAGSGINKAAEGISDAIPMAKMFKAFGQAGENLIVGNTTGEKRKKRQKISSAIFAPHKLLAMRKQKKAQGNPQYAEDGMRVPVRLLKKGGEVYEKGGEVDVNDLLEALEGDKKRELNKVLNQAHREELKSAEEEGYADLKTERDERRAERKDLNQAFFDEMRSDDPGMEEGEGGGGMGKEDLKKILQALAGGTLGFGAMAVIPKIVKLLKKDKPPISGSTVYGPGESPGPRDPFWREPDQPFRGRYAEGGKLPPGKLEDLMSTANTSNLLDVLRFTKGGEKVIEQKEKEEEDRKIAARALMFGGETAPLSSPESQPDFQYYKIPLSRREKKINEEKRDKGWGIVKKPQVRVAEYNEEKGGYNPGIGVSELKIPSLEKLAGRPLKPSERKKFKSLLKDPQMLRYFMDMTGEKDLDFRKIKIKKRTSAGRGSSGSSTKGEGTGGRPAGEGNAFVEAIKDKIAYLCMDGSCK